MENARQSNSVTSTDISLAITIGDPAGIGPEVVLKALADPEIQQLGQFTVIGSRQSLQATYETCRQNSTEHQANLAHPDDLNLIDIQVDGIEAIKLGAGTAVSGQASFTYLKTAIAQTLEERYQGIVTAPISKATWAAAGHAYPGQTELLAELSGSDRFGMMFLAQSPHTDWILRVLLATTHIPLKQVPVALTAQRLSDKLSLLIQSLRQEHNIAAPRIAIAGLNPHSGEQGQLGSEEQGTITPWLQTQRPQYSDVILDGPIPPDTLWVTPGKAWFLQSTQTADAYLAMYHDQGLIPTKLMAFDQAVNTTIGLPFVRTSPDHGTAFDIAGQNRAQPESMKAALKWGVMLAQQRFRHGVIARSMP